MYVPCARVKEGREATQAGREFAESAWEAVSPEGTPTSGEIQEANSACTWRQKALMRWDKVVSVSWRSEVVAEKIDQLIRRRSGGWIESGKARRYAQPAAGYSVISFIRLRQQVHAIM
jgi:hypothetical protein